jgi:hypothetical protein
VDWEDKGKNSLDQEKGGVVAVGANLVKDHGLVRMFQSQVAANRALEARQHPEILC